MKQCSRCLNKFPETEEYFLRYLDNRYDKYRLKSHCRECGKIGSKKWREENKERYRTYHERYRLTENAQNAKRKYNATHTEKIKAYKNQYRRDNKDKIKAYDKKKRIDPVTREHVLIMTRRWKSNNKERVSSYMSKYSKENIDYFRMKAQERKSRMRELEHTLTLEEWEETKAFFNSECCYCGKRLNRLTQDHFIPLSKKGIYAKANIVPACKKCNSSKKDSDFKEWYKKQEFYSRERETLIYSYLKTYGNTEVSKNTTCHRNA